MIDLFIEQICDILDIPKPKLSYDTSNFCSKTMLAQCEAVSNTIYIKQFDKPNPDHFFCIVHELRHIWQFKNNEDLYFSSYQTSDKCSSIEEYNLQLAEIDANAFAALILIEFFGLKPLFNGISESTKSIIFKRLATLEIEYRDLLSN